MPRDFQKDLDRAERRFARSIAECQVAQEEYDKAIANCRGDIEAIEALIRPFEPTKRNAIMVNTYAFWFGGDGQLQWAALVHPSNLPDLQVYDGPCDEVDPV